MIAAQLARSVLGYTELSTPDALDRIWTGGAIASFPGYLAGCAVQALMRPGSFRELGVDAHCGIYAQRPSPCRELKPAWEDGTASPQCDKARVAYGMAPLSPQLWLVANPEDAGAG